MSNKPSLDVVSFPALQKVNVAPIVICTKPDSEKLRLL